LVQESEEHWSTCTDDQQDAQVDVS